MHFVHWKIKKFLWFSNGSTFLKGRITSLNLTLRTASFKLKWTTIISLPPLARNIYKLTTKFLRIHHSKRHSNKLNLKLTRNFLLGRCPIYVLHIYVKNTRLNFKHKCLSLVHTVKYSLFATYLPSCKHYGAFIINIIHLNLDYEGYKEQ